MTSRSLGEASLRDSPAQSCHCSAAITTRARRTRKSGNGQQLDSRRVNAPLINLVRDCCGSLVGHPFHCWSRLRNTRSDHFCHFCRIVTNPCANALRIRLFVRISPSEHLRSWSTNSETGDRTGQNRRPGGYFCSIPSFLAFSSLLLHFCTFGRLLSPSDIQGARSWGSGRNYTFILE